MSHGWFNDSIRTFEGKEAAELLKLTSEDLLRLGIADAVLEESGKTPEAVAKEMKKLLVSSLKELDKIRISVLLASRYQRYRRIGDLWN